MLDVFTATAKFCIPGMPIMAQSVIIIIFFVVRNIDMTMEYIV